GKKKGVIRKLEKDMNILAEAARYEEAAKTRDKIFALKYAQDVSLLSADNFIKEKNSNFKFQFFKKFQNSNIKKNSLDRMDELSRQYRIEAYDISNISGKYAVGSMVVFLDGEMAKNEYRKFKIRTVKEANDIAMLKEVLERRFKHIEWQMPNLILMDGGKAQVNAANKILDFRLQISDFKSKEKTTRPMVIGVAKGPNRKKLDLYLASSALSPLLAGGGQIDKKLIARIMAEAHRFAISYHRILRGKALQK
ncbi:MAG: UvrB/UvrC motif-containing protein, partial [bacterium]